ncbi:hypothetical protein MB02_07730 [Croceicoccus estronivorus]|nr:hypothetical protein MB02_07730 [Croceicoccus estronivorus]
MYSAPGINLQLRTYSHDTPSQAGKARRDHVLSFSLNGRPQGSTGCYVRRHRQTRPFRFGDITFVPGGVPIIGWGPGGVQQTLSCRLDRGMFKVLAPFEDGLSDERLLACGDIRTPGMSEIMRRLAAELRSPGFAHETMVNLLIQTAMVDVVRHVRQTIENQRPVAGGLSAAQLRRVTEYIESSLAQSPTISELAQACGISPGHLMRCFRQSTGETIHEHVQRTRIGRAQLLLAEKGHSIKEIAHMLGFATASSFSVAFKRSCGQSPSDFRRLVRH